MAFISLIIGFICIIALVVAFFPFLGFLHWFIVPMATVGVILGLVNLVKKRGNFLSASGIMLCTIALIIGILKIAGFPDMNI